MAGGAGAADVDHQPQRVVRVHAGPPDDPLVEHVEARDPADLARAARRARRPTCPSSSSPLHDRVAAGRVERAAQQAAGAGRLDQRDRAVDDALVDAGRVAEVEDRRLGEAADDLVGRGEHEVGPALERRGGQPRGEAQVRAPGLVHDERDAGGVSDLGERRDVGDGAEVGRGGDHHRDGVRARRRAPAPAVSGVAQWAMPSSASTSGATKCGSRPARIRPSIVEEWAFRWTTTPLPDVGERQAHGVVAARAAVDQEPASAWRPRPRPRAPAPAGRSWLDVDPTSIPGIPAGMSSSSARSADRLAQPGVGGGPALVARHDEAARGCACVVDEGVQVGSAALVERGPARRCAKLGTA